MQRVVFTLIFESISPPPRKAIECVSSRVQVCNWPTLDLSSDCTKCNIYILKRNLNKPKIASYCFKETELCVPVLLMRPQKSKSNKRIA